MAVRCYGTLASREEVDYEQIRTPALPRRSLAPGMVDATNANLVTSAHFSNWLSGRVAEGSYTLPLSQNCA